MARKIILALAGLAASLTLAVGLAAAGFAPFPAPAEALVLWRTIRSLAR